MGSKRLRNKHQGTPAPSPRRWWQTWWAVLALFPLGTLIAVLGLAEAYKSSGADELRTQVYQPLFADVAAWRKSVDTLGVEEPATTKGLTALQRTGAFYRIRESLRTEILRLSEESQKLHVAAVAVDEIALREISARLLNLRTEESDRLWHEKTSTALRELSLSQKGIADTVTQTLRHEARTRAIDVRNPKQLIATDPGGPTFVVRDWVTYPDSLPLIEELWTELDYLYFNNRPTDVWYYRMTREDLKQSGHNNLKAFLDPTHRLLQTDASFQILLNSRPQLLRDIAALESQLSDRIQTPKQFSDLFAR